MIVVSDTSPMINLAAIGRLELLPALFGKVIIPEKVFEEIVVAGQGLRGAEEIRTASWVEVKAVSNKQKVNSLFPKIHAGEAEDADVVILDDADARAVAESLGVEFTGLLGILLRAKKSALITAIRPVMDDLLNQTSFRISKSVYTQILLLAGE